MFENRREAMVEVMDWVTFYNHKRIALDAGLRQSHDVCATLVCGPAARQKVRILVRLCSPEFRGKVSLVSKADIGDCADTRQQQRCAAHVRLFSRHTLPQHVETELKGVAAHLGQCAEFVVESLVGMRFFMLLERGPIGHDGDVVVGHFD